jgi:hypothetical protein
MNNYFGVDQPFCRNPKMIVYNKNLPIDTGRSEDGKHSWLPRHIVLGGDLYYHSMDSYEVTARRILGCASHSAFRQHDLEVIAAEKEMIREQLTPLFNYIMKEWIDTDKPPVSQYNEVVKTLNTFKENLQFIDDKRKD